MMQTNERSQSICGDCLEVLASMPDCSVDSIVTDPPYGLSSMGKKWDYDVPSKDIWRECLRVLKPGGHLLCFSSSRTYHRMAFKIEDAGFEIRDQIMWVYGSGFPKSMDISRAIDKAAGAKRINGKREWSGGPRTGGIFVGGIQRGTARRTIYDAPVTKDAAKWQGWGTALKPAHEPVVVARKPFENTVSENVLKYGTSALNIDGCRVGSNEGYVGVGPGTISARVYGVHSTGRRALPVPKLGRWPTNFIHDGSEEVTELLGSAARFFYCPKASKADREAGLDEMPLRMENELQGRHNGFPDGKIAVGRNHHPMVKPTELMRYLCRLVTPPDGVVLDPFMGSGTTGKAAVLEGFRFIGIEREREYVEIAKARIKHAEDHAQATLCKQNASALNTPVTS